MRDPDPATSPGDETAPAPEPAARRVLRDAMQAHRSNRHDDARDAYRRALAIDPDDPDVLHLYGVFEAQFGRLEQALELVGRAAELRPLEPMFHNNLGNVLNGLERMDDAERHYRRAIELDPGRLDAMNNLAVLFGRRGRLDDAESAFVELLSVAPGFADARENLASLYFRQGRLPDAVRHCAMALVTAPHDRAMRRLLGVAYASLGMHAEAVAVYRQWLDDEPDSLVAAHHLAALTGHGIPQRAPDGYVQAVFDAFAQSFESKLAELSYAAPALVAQAVADSFGAPVHALRVADLGCGTGLCAPRLAPYASRLVGVDLSAGMLELAGARGQYDALYQGDLTEFLRGQPRAFDLLVAADTLCYLGVLGDFASAARTALSPGGVLAFTVEAHEADAEAPDWRLHAHGRYSHRADYVARALQAAGFDPPVLTGAVLRQEAGQAVRGWVVRAGAGAVAAAPAPSA